MASGGKRTPTGHHHLTLIARLSEANCLDVFTIAIGSSIIKANPHQNTMVSRIDSQPKRSILGLTDAPFGPGNASSSGHIADEQPAEHTATIIPPLPPQACAFHEALGRGNKPQTCADCARPSGTPLRLREVSCPIHAGDLVAVEVTAGYCTQEKIGLERPVTLEGNEVLSMFIDTISNQSGIRQTGIPPQSINTRSL